MTVAPFSRRSYQGRVRFGPGTVADVADEVEAIGAQRALVFSGGSGRRVAARIGEQLGQRAVGAFTDVRQHVPSELADQATAVAREVEADVLITVGGGSAVGLAKAVTLKLPVQIVAVPTTYAGSEVTPFWGLSTEGRKTVGRDPRVAPAAVVYDPLLTLDLPAEVTATSAMNALAHCVEAHYAPDANPVTTMLAREGAARIAGSLPRVVAQPRDVVARADLLYGAYLGGIAVAEAGTSIHHKACHVLGGSFGLPHAPTHAVLLPHVVHLATERFPEAVVDIAAPLDAKDSARALFELAASVPVPRSLEELGLVSTDLDAAAEAVAEAWRGIGVSLETTRVRTLLRNAWHGRAPWTS